MPAASRACWVRGLSRTATSSVIVSTPDQRCLASESLSLTFQWTLKLAYNGSRVDVEVEDYERGQESKIAYKSPISFDVRGCTAPDPWLKPSVLA